MCREEGKAVAASVVDHVVPHTGEHDPLFWDESNLQSLCYTHHNSTKQRMDKGGGRIGCDKDGIPVDPDHPWH